MKLHIIALIINIMKRDIAQISTTRAYLQKMVNCDLYLEREMGYISLPFRKNQTGKGLITQLVITRSGHMQNIGLQHKESSPGCIRYIHWEKKKRCKRHGIIIWSNLNNYYFIFIPVFPKLSSLFATVLVVCSKLYTYTLQDYKLQAHYT